MFLSTPLSIIPLMSFFATISFSMHRNHLLMALLTLESIILSFLLIPPIFSCPHSIFLAIIILTFGACEASLGLAILVVLARSYGTDKMKSFINTKC